MKKLKLGRVWFWLCIPIINRDFTGFECPNAFNPTRLKKILLLDCRGKINPLVRAKCPIIRF
ncbi:hypothetical protein C2R54_02585 [Helicobacter pylori]|nr:hypothetical protein C2R54_02585 [Helicobacter pylori]